MGRGLDGLFCGARLCGDCAVLKDREGWSLTFSGGFGEGETPLPIPNRAVKPLSADGTWPARAWESRTPPVYFRCGPPSGGPSLLHTRNDPIGGPGQASEARSKRRLWIVARWRAIVVCVA